MKVPVENMNPDCSPRSSVSDVLLRQDLDENYTIIKELGRGTYGRVVLAKCHQTKSEVALKMLPKSATKLRDFLREFNFSYYLSPHSSILNTYDLAFETPAQYVFAQEHAPLGDLFETITPQVGLHASQAQNVVRSIASALEFMHSKGLVHRDIKPENILMFDCDLDRIKLMDFGMTKKEGTMVKKVSKGIPYTPPEICDALKGERYSVDTGADIWAFAVLIFCILTGNFPWELAHSKDMFYNEFISWQRRKTVKFPSQWRRFTPRLMRLFRRMLEPRLDKRCAVIEVHKYMSDTWLIPIRKCTQALNDETDPMEELNNVLQKHGIETTISKKIRERRISEWVLST